MKAVFASLFLAASLTAQPGPISGRWHLLPTSEDGNNVSGHRVELVFRNGQSGLIGAIINRNTGEDIPLANLKFDGNILTLQMANAAPVLTMTAKGDKFEGHWMNGAEEVGPLLKLVRFR